MNHATDVLRISCMQAEGRPGDVEHNLDLVDRAAVQARGDGADLLITPEMFLTGYDCGDLAPLLEPDRDLAGRVAAIAARHRIAILAGLPIALPEGGISNAAVFVDDTGQTLGVHHKSHLYGAIDKDRFHPGAHPATIVDYRGVRIGVLICFELEFPEPARLAALSGAQLIAVPTSNMEPYAAINEHLVWTRAWENQTYVAYVNRCGTERNTHYVGRTVVHGPGGELIARADTSPTLLTADICIPAVAAARHDFSYLAERRPNLYAGLAHLEPQLPAPTRKALPCT